MARHVAIHDPRTKRKAELLAAAPSPPKPPPAKVYIILNWIDGTPGAHITGAFANRPHAIDVVRSITGDKEFQPGRPARMAQEAWDVIESGVIEKTG